MQYKSEAQDNSKKNQQKYKSAVQRKKVQDQSTRPELQVISL